MNWTQQNQNVSFVNNTKGVPKSVVATLAIPDNWGYLVRVTGITANGFHIVYYASADGAAVPSNVILTTNWIAIW